MTNNKEPNIEELMNTYEASQKAHRDTFEKIQSVLTSFLKKGSVNQSDILTAIENLLITVKNLDTHQLSLFSDIVKVLNSIAIVRTENLILTSKLRTVILLLEEKNIAKKGELEALYTEKVLPEILNATGLSMEDLKAGSDKQATADSS